MFRVPETSYAVVTRHCLYLCRFKWKKSCTVTPEVEVESHCNFKK